MATAMNDPNPSSDRADTAHNAAAAPLRSLANGAERVVHRTRKSIETSNRLIDACIEELKTVGFDGLTIRNVASRAGVAAATAYNHFSSRELLVTEVFWRQLENLPETTYPNDASTVERVSATLEDLACVLADEPDIASACNIAMLSSEDAVRSVRDRIGAEFHRRLSAALFPTPHVDQAALSTGATRTQAPDCGLMNAWESSLATHRTPSNPDILTSLELALSGAMLHAGMGHLSYDELPAQLRRVAEIIVGPTGKCNATASSSTQHSQEQLLDAKGEK